jgi:hypothetical protein
VYTSSYRYRSNLRLCTGSNCSSSASVFTCHPSNPFGARFSAPVLSGSDVQPASCTMSTGSFTGVKRAGRGVDQPPPSSTEVKERVKLYLYSPTGSSWPVLGGNLLLPLPYWVRSFYKFFSSHPFILRYKCHTDIHHSPATDSNNFCK